MQPLHCLIIVRFATNARPQSKQTTGKVVSVFERFAVNKSINGTRIEKVLWGVCFECLRISTTPHGDSRNGDFTMPLGPCER